MCTGTQQHKYDRSSLQSKQLQRLEYVYVEMHANVKLGRSTGDYYSICAGPVHAYFGGQPKTIRVTASEDHLGNAAQHG